jgi:glucose-6-phosphate dehydrogenase assembly protein OpcA
MSATVGERVEHFTSGHAVSVDVRAIERELASLWRQTSERGQSVARACLWNLVAPADDDACAERAKKLFDDTAAVCPSRALLLRLSESGDGPELEAWISANCHLAPGGGKLLCSEEVTLRAYGAGRSHVPALVRALLVPDVPTALLLLGDAPPSDATLDALSACADRVVFDSTAWPAGALRTLSAMAHAGANVTDLAWLRLEPARLMLASLFDPPVGGEPLRSASRVVLRHAPGGDSSAALFAGWLADRLGWQIAELRPGGAKRWLVLASGHNLELVLECEEAHTTDSRARMRPVCEVRIESAAGTYTIRDAGPERLELAGTHLPTRVVSAPERVDAELLVASLGARGRDKRLALALTRAAELAA